MGLRIIAGSYRGRTLSTSKGRDTRPTIDRVREAMMSSVTSAMGGVIEGAVLDAFAGSGALGLEALSRGARACVFYEHDRLAADTIRRNIAALGIPQQSARLCRADCLTAAKRSRLMGGPFSLVLLDPPYDLPSGEVISFLGDLADAHRLACPCTIVYEHRAGDFPDVCGMPVHMAGRELELYAQKTYGIVGVTIFVLTDRLQGRPSS
jgi:16S rRNA (guanine966-N2)-methyltransferase